MKKVILLILSIYSVFLADAQVYDYVVAKDGSGNFTSLQAAIDAAPTGTSRSCIFVKKGVYSEKVYLGSASASISKVISLIGENRDSVILTNADYNGLSKPYYTGTTNITYGTPQSATLTLNASDFYMENMTVRNTSTTAQAVAVYNAADRQTFKNCRFVGYQDTHYPKKGRRGFYYKTLIEGRTDFICGGGPNYFLQCTLKSVVAGGYVTAPEDITYKATLSTGKTLYYGFVFKNCDLINDGLVTTGSTFLGRPWQNTSGSVYLDCKLGNHISAAGWNPWSADITTVSMAEFRSLNASGTALADVSSRVAWSMQLSAADVNAYLKLTSVYASLGSATAYDPLPLVVGPTPVSTVEKNGLSLLWPEVAGSKGYVIYANGSVVGFSKTPSFTDSMVRGNYSVCVVGPHGNLSLADGQVDPISVQTLNDVVNGTVATPLTSVHTSANVLVREGRLQFQTSTDCELYSLTGQRVLNERGVLSADLKDIPKGLYLLKTFDGDCRKLQTKILL